MARTTPARPAAGINRGPGHYFVQVPFALLDDERVPGLAIAVYCALARFLTFGTDGGAYPGHAKLAKLAGVSLATVKRALDHLKATGWVEWESGAAEGETNRYTVHAAPLHQRKVERGVAQTELPGSSPTSYPPRSDRATTERQFTEIHPPEPERVPVAEARVSNDSGPSLSEALCIAVLEGLRQNRKVLEMGEPRPLNAMWESSIAAAEALQKAGVPADFATRYFRIGATEYQPTTKAPRIGSLKYLLGGCLTAWQEKQKVQPNAELQRAFKVLLPEGTTPGPQRVVQPESVPGAAAAGFSSIKEVLAKMPGAVKKRPA